MELSTPMILAAAVLLTAVAALLLALPIVRRTVPSGGPGTAGTDADSCAICFGYIDGRVAVCGCGRVFHDSCALPTGSCPYCGSEYGSFEVREENRVRCLNCGRRVTGRTCACGAVFPDDGEFVCGHCGAVIGEDLICPGCGTVYVMNTGKGGD